MNDSSYRDSHIGKGGDYDVDLSKGNFDSYMMTHESKILENITRELFPNKIPKYLDFACGTGRITSLVEKHAKTSFGFDVSESMVSEARRKCNNTQFHIVDLTASEAPEKGFNLVTAFRFFGNAEQDLRHSVLKELSKVIETGGYLVINNHRNPWSLHELFLKIKGDSNKLELSPKNLNNLLESNGFKVEKKIGVGIWVCRYNLRKTAASSTSILRFLEPLSKISFLAPICPDYVVVAKKV